MVEVLLSLVQPAAFLLLFVLFSWGLSRLFGHSLIHALRVGPRAEFRKFAGAISFFGFLTFLTLVASSQWADVFLAILTPEGEKATSNDGRELQLTFGFFAFATLVLNFILLTILNLTGGRARRR